MEMKYYEEKAREIQDFNAHYDNMSRGVRTHREREDDEEQSGINRCTTLVMF